MTEIALTRINVIMGYKKSHISNLITYILKTKFSETKQPLIDISGPAHPLDMVCVADEYINILPECVIISTFSEEFILRFRRRIAEGKLASEAVKLFVAYDDPEKYREITFNSEGDCIGELDNFFLVGYEEVCALHRAQRKKNV